MRDILLIIYLFLGGASAGAFLVISCWSLVFYNARAPKGRHIVRAFSALQGRAYLFALVLMGVSVICLLGDLGVPERALLLFTKPHFTLITLGAYCLAAQLVVGCVLVAYHTFGFIRPGKMARQALDVVCAVLSLVIMAYTGAFLSTNPVPFWSSFALIPLFTLSSLSAGITLVLLVDWVTRGQVILLRAARPLQKAHLACLVAEAIALAGFTWSTLNDPGAATSTTMLFESPMLANALVGVVGMGLIVPLCAEVFSLSQTDVRNTPAADAVCLLGAFMLRYVIVSCGMA